MEVEAKNIWHDKSQPEELVQTLSVADSEAERHTEDKQQEVDSLQC